MSLRGNLLSFKAIRLDHYLLVHLALLKILGLFLPIKKEETQEYQSQELLRVSIKTL